MGRAGTYPRRNSKIRGKRCNFKAKSPRIENNTIAIFWKSNFDITEGSAIGDLDHADSAF